MSTIPEKKKLIIDPASNFASPKTWRTQRDAINLLLISSCNCEQSWFVGTKPWYTDIQLHLFPQIQASPHCSRVKIWDLCSCQQPGNPTHPGKHAQPHQRLCTPCSWTRWERTAKHGCNRGGSHFLSQACTYQRDYSKSKRIPSLLRNPSTLACPLALASRHSHHSSFCPLSHTPLLFTQCNLDFLPPWEGQKLFERNLRGAEIERGKNCSKVGWVRWDFIKHKTKRTPKHKLKEQKLYAFVQCNFV